MEVKQENRDRLNAVLTVKIEQTDFEERVNKVLKDYRRKARVDGFRPGMVPMGLIRKMYYTPVLVDEVNKLVSESLFAYLKEENVKILGEPLPHRSEEKRIDFENDKEFTFSFDVGLAPEITLEISSRDKIPYYTIKIEKKELQNYKESYQRRFGEFINVEEAVEDEMIKGTLVKVDREGKIVENGILAENISMSLEMIKDPDQRLLFKGARAGEEIIFDIKQAYPSDAEVASLLRIQKEEVQLIDGKFKCKIDVIQRFKEAAVNQDLFDKVYGEGEVKNEQEFEERLMEEMRRNYRSESEYRFLIDSRNVLIKKAKIDLPVEFLKRWMVETNENLTADQVEQDFAKYEDDFRWQLIKEYLVEKQGITVTDAEALQTAKGVALNQYLQYGISNVPEDYLENYAREMLSKPEESRRIRDRRAEEKLLDYLRNTAKIDEKEITPDKFRKLFEK